MATIKKILKPAEEKQTSSVLDDYFSDKTIKHYNHITPKGISISTGSLLLDSVIKTRTGQVVNLVGKGAEVGKSSQALVFAENVMETIEKSRTIFIAGEGRCSKELRDRSGLKFVENKDEWVVGTVFVLWENVAEDVFNLVKNLLEESYEKGETLCVIIDSLDGLILRDDLKAKKIGESVKVAGVPLITKLFFRHCAIPISRYDAFVVLLSQYSAQIKVNEYQPTSPNHGSSSGGSSKQHQADYVFDYNKVNHGNLILEDPKAKPSATNKILGKVSKITILKSASDVSMETHDIPIRKSDSLHKGKRQIWVEKEIADFVMAYQMAVKSGSWINFSQEILNEAKENGIDIPEKVQGLHNLYILIEENKPVMDYFYNKIKKMIDVS